MEGRGKGGEGGEGKGWEPPRICMLPTPMQPNNGKPLSASAILASDLAATATSGLL
jgi:hypothetical protein